jgi:hypothetical protein
MKTITVKLDAKSIAKIERYKAAQESDDNTPEGYREFIDSALDVVPLLTGSYNFHLEMENIKTD